MKGGEIKTEASEKVGSSFSRRFWVKGKRYDQVKDVQVVAGEGNVRVRVVYD